MLKLRGQNHSWKSARAAKSTSRIIRNYPNTSQGRIRHPTLPPIQNRPYTTGLKYLISCKKITSHTKNTLQKQLILFSKHTNTHTAVVQRGSKGRGGCVWVSRGKPGKADGGYAVGRGGQNSQSGGSSAEERRPAVSSNRRTSRLTCAVQNCAS